MRKTVLFTFLFVSIKTAIIASALATNVTYAPGIYRLKCVNGRGRGKYLAFRRSHTKLLTHSPFLTKSSCVLSALLAGNMIFGALLFTSNTSRILPLVGIIFGMLLGGHVLMIPIRYLLSTDALILSKSRSLQFVLEASDKAPKAFTLKTRLTRRSSHGGNFINVRNATANQIFLQEEKGLSFVATRFNPQYPNHVHLQVVDSEDTSQKWLRARTKRVYLHSETSSIWMLSRHFSSSESTDGSSIEDV